MLEAERLAVASLLAETDLTGRKVGEFQILRRLGRGGMGEVYLAEQESLRRQVALKVLRSSLATDGNYVQRFSHEARAAARLTHANIVQIYEVGACEGIHYIAQEYVPGQNLRQLLTRRGRPLELSLALGVMRQVAAALQKAGEQGIVHRDIKPENILLTPDGEVKVADFGLARVSADAEALHLTQLGMTMGSPLYMSPEQAEGRPVDPRSDLYSFGATCYHMIGGRPPFTGETPLAIAVQHVKSEPTPLLELRPDVPDGICRIVHRLLAKRPDDRFNSASEVLRAIRDLKGSSADGIFEGLEEWSTPELIAMSEARYAATERLDRLLKTQAVQLQRRSPRWLPWTLVAGGLLGGVVLGSVLQPTPLLETTPQERTSLDVKKLASPAQQWMYADMTKSEEAWKAVEHYFPPNESAANLQFSRKAIKGLADFYRQIGRLDEAAAQYTRLTKLSTEERQFRMQGFAGLALVADLQSRPDDARRELAQVWADRGLLDLETQGELESLRKKLQ